MKLLLLFGAMLIILGCQSQHAHDDKPSGYFSARDPRLVCTGRFLDLENGKQFAWSGSRIDVRFSGTSCDLLLRCLPGVEHLPFLPLVDYYLLIVDGQESVITIGADTEFVRVDSLASGEHQLTLFKRTEALVAEGIFSGVILDPDAALLPPSKLPARNIEFIGNSITCGYGNEGESASCPFSPETENAWLTYSHLAAQSLDARYVSVCYSGKGVFQNYDKTRTETMPDLWSRYSPSLENTWDYSWIPEVVVINLGTNDFAHRVPDRKSFIEAYLDLIKRVRASYPGASIVCLTGSMMSGKRLITIQAYLHQAVKAANMPRLYRFDLSTQGALGYGCSSHPNVAQHQKNGAELSVFLEEIWP